LTETEQKEFQRVNRIAAIYNMMPNLLWTALFLIPITIFCYHFMYLKLTYSLLGVSMIPLFLPNTFFDRMQLSKKTSWYKRIGVRIINTFAQHGTIMNKIIEKKYPGFKAIYKTRASIKKQFYQTYFYEKFHFSLFVFFTMVTIYAGIQKQFLWVLILIICNVLYNIYPNLLQQYIRLKLRSALATKKLK
jgi:hypothetical protein